MASDCPRGGDHDPVFDSETESTVTHKCTKCSATWTRAKQK